MQGQPAGGEATEHHGEPPPVRRRQSHPRRDRRRKRRLHGVVSAIGPGPVTPPAPAAAAQSSNCALRTSQRWWMEKLFAELKAELELHTSLEEEHLFPILRRNAETKALVTDAIKDNKELRAKLAELDALPKNDEAFPERLKELQKAFRQHARDEKTELLPAVQRALSEEQVQAVAERMEAGLAEAEQARQDEAEEQRARA